MKRLSLRKIKISDKKYFAKWWRDKDLLKLTSGRLRKISNKEVDEYFSFLIKNKSDYDFMVSLNKKVIGNISLAKRRTGWHEIQIVIGEKKYWGKGYGSKAIKLLANKVRRSGIYKIFLEVRPNNIRAIRAYERSGFQKVGLKSYPKNKYLPETLRMELDVKERRK